MRTGRISFFGVAVAAMISAADAHAAEFEQFCTVRDHPVAARQTIIVLDEHHIVREEKGKPSPDNVSWRRAITGMLDFQRTGFRRDFLPRERVSLYLARKDGAGAVRLFTGCLPFFSEEEERRAGDTAGSVSRNMDWFFGTGAAAAAKKAQERFRNDFGITLVTAATGDNLSARAMESQSFAESGLVSSLRRSPLITLSQGVPRIFVYSDFARFPTEQFRDVKSARELGFRDGAEGRVPFEGAELFLLGSTGGQRDRLLQEYLFAFALSNKALLHGMASTGTVPALQPGPVSVRVYQGKINYPNGAYPMRLRLSVDRNGTAINSWIAVQTDVERVTPVRGTLVCQAGGKNCSFIGDKVLAQVWSLSGGQEPEFDAKIPFGGARELEFSLDGDAIKGRIFDSSLTIRGTSDNSLRFELAHAATAEF